MNQIAIQHMLEFIDLNGENGFDDSKIEELERIILDCQQNMVKKGTDDTFDVADSIYDTLWDMLKKVRPSSHVLSEIWEEDGDITDYTELLVKNPMMSIETAKSWTCKVTEDFINRMPVSGESYFASYKINGHGIRVVYVDGELVSATSRARASAGRDLTRHMRILLGDFNDALMDYGMVELRGELCLRLDRLSDARQFNPLLKSAFSAVSSLVKPSATEGEIRLLDFLCYGIIMEDANFQTREEEFFLIKELGYETPGFVTLEDISRRELLPAMQQVVQAFEDDYEQFGYFCDGVVFEINDREQFSAFGTEGNHNCGNIALKVGVWEQTSYSGYVQKILWKRGKTKLSPVALVAESPGIIDEDADGRILNMDKLGVLTAQGNTVRRVPLYEPKNIIILDAYIDCPICFRYGGEAGVVPCFPDGRLLKEDAAKEILCGINIFETPEEELSDEEYAQREEFVWASAYAE